MSDQDYKLIGVGLCVLGAAIASGLCIASGHEDYGVIFMIGGALGCWFN